MSVPATKTIAHIIDLTLWKADASQTDVEKVCAAARQYSFAAVCVNGSRVAQAYHLVEESGVKISCLVGFPLGAMDADTKRFEVEAALDNGAQEFDVVLNVGRLKEGDHGYVLRELRDLVDAADERTVKVLIEAGVLTREEKITAAQLVMDSGAQFVALGTGFLAAGQSVDDVKLVREIVGERFGTKVCAVQDAKFALALSEAGVTRMGVEAGRDVVLVLGGEA